MNNWFRAARYLSFLQLSLLNWALALRQWWVGVWVFPLLQYCDFYLEYSVFVGRVLVTHDRESHFDLIPGSDGDFAMLTA